MEQVGLKSNSSYYMSELLLEPNSKSEAVEFIPSEAIASNTARRIAEIVLDLTISLLASFTGIFTNIIVVIVFARQGFKDSVSVSMSTIAVWDFIKCLGGAMQRMTGPISLFSDDMAESWSNISVAVFNYLVSFSCYVTSALAAYVAIERCLCVTMPLKIKWLLTRKVSLTVCIVISVTVFSCFAPIFGIYDIVWEFRAKFNATIAVYRFNDFSEGNDGLFKYYNLSGILWPLFSLVIIVISTGIISYKLRQASAFRYKHNETKFVTSVQGSDHNKNPKQAPKQISKRDQKVIKMLLVIIAIYIVSLSPRECIYIAKYFNYEFYFLRKYHNIFVTVCYVAFVLDFINGFVNLFVFLAMSSAFKATFMEMLPSRLKNWTCLKFKCNEQSHG